MTDAFGTMAATLSGTAPPSPTRADALAGRLARASEALRATGDPELVEMGDGLQRWCHEGGDLARLLGIKARRGGRNEVPRNHARRQAMVVTLKFLVTGPDGRIADPRRAGKVLSAHLIRSPSLVRAIREISGADRVPTSEKSLVGIFRGTES